MTTTLIAIGGAMDLATPGVAAREFYELAGGPQARVVILPTASELPDAGVEMQQALLHLGMQQAPIILPIRTRQDAMTADCSLIETATAVFFAGGAQLRYTAAFGGTAIEQALLAAHARGALMGGSSAGAAVLSHLMIAVGRGGSSPRLGQAQFSRGLGFTDRAIFDQHFRQRDRLGRLIYAVCQHPGLIGVGVDEDTAAVLTEDGPEAHLRVVGRNAVTIVDGRQITASDVAEREMGQPVAVAGLVVHVLTNGGEFDLATGKAVISARSL
jgi:cyanophycinase